MKYSLKHKQAGFSVVELIIILLVLGAVGFVGYLVYGRMQSKNSTSPTSSSSSASTTPSSSSSTTTSSESVASTGLTYESGIRLQPKDFGVASGQPVADVSVIKLSNGSWRIYAFGQGKGVVSATSKDGLKFKAESGARLPDGSGMPRAVKLSNGKIRIYYVDAGKISSAISSNGVSFTKESGTRISPPSGVSEISGVSTPVKLADGKWHIFFSELPKPGAMVKPMHVYSATSSDLLTWKNQSGVRVGGGKSAASAEHPDAVVNKDGKLILYFFVNNPQKLVYATSTDGLKFSEAKDTGLDCNDPNIVNVSGDNYRIYCGLFDDEIGGIIKSAKTGLAD